MLATGVIVEYNPFHNGHLYHITKSKELTEADVIIAVMSGNFLQRGEPAAVDKWTRTHFALSAGADVVFELPIVYSTQNAELFAYGAVSLLDQLNSVQALCFGSEIGCIQNLQKVADRINDESLDFKHTLQEQLDEGISYPKAMANAMSSIHPDSVNEGIFSPNNMLGIMYLSALKRLDSRIKPYTVKRIAAQYHQTEIDDTSIASATAIRKQILDDTVNTIKDYVPETTFTNLSESYSTIITLDDFRDLLFAKINGLSTLELQAFIDVDEGIEYRIKKFINQVDSVTQLVEKIKCKRYTWTRIQRMLIHILLDMKKEAILPIVPTPYARILGFTAKGQEFLQLAKSVASIPIVTKWKKPEYLYASYDYYATRIYSLVEEKKRVTRISYHQLANRDFTLPPIRL